MTSGDPQEMRDNLPPHGDRFCQQLLQFGSRIFSVEPPDKKQAQSILWPLTEDPRQLRPDFWHHRHTYKDNWAALEVCKNNKVKNMASAFGIFQTSLRMKSSRRIISSLTQ